MKVWIIAEGEPLPCIEDARLMRMGMLAEYLDGRDHEVTLWASTFIHGTKKYYCNEYKELRLGNRSHLYLLHSPIAYQKNTSLKRILYHEILGKEFYKRCQTKDRPDVILCSYPTEQFARYAEHYAKKYDIPVIIDARDLWPDIFKRAFPVKLQGVAKLGLIPLDKRAKRAFRRADVITGVVPYACEWGLKKAGRVKRELDETIYIGYNNQTISQELMNQEIERWNQLGVTADTWNICFVGTLSSNSLDILTCIRAVRKLENKYPNIRLVVCGAGDGMEDDMREAEGCANIAFAGWCNNSQIQSVLSIGDVGLYCYKNLEDFKEAFGNKIIAYMAAGLPVLSSLEGFSKRYIKEFDVGELYTEGSVDSCMKMIEDMYLHSDKCLRQGKNAKKRFDIDFDAEVVNQQFERTLKDTIEIRKTLGTKEKVDL